ncbi:MAG: Do family serine endopeptidase [Elusimicrobia bacterium]|nr:Do family serine endopeptidase [Elusimicrobiota bacterium]
MTFQRNQKLSVSVLWVALGPLATPWAAPPGEFQKAFVEIAHQAKPAVVNITAIHEQQVLVQPPSFFFGDPEDFLDRFQGQPRVRKWRTHGTGSGAIIDSRGHVLTNEHVVRGATQIKVTLTGADGTEKTYDGKVIGRDPNLDLAVVRISASGPFPSLKLGDSSRAQVGEWVVAIGSPFELEQTVTVGIVSAVRQTLVIEGRPYRNLIQTDASINRGNSGGPLLNMDGELIGVNTAIFSPSGASAGIGFAIPINEAKEVLDYLIAGKSLQRGWLGVEASAVTEAIRRQFRLSGAEGALVNSVVPDSPAQAAGLRRGDVIVRFNRRPIRDPIDLIREVGRGGAGKKVPVEIVRGGKKAEVRVVLGERPDSIEEAAAEPRGESPQELPNRESSELQWEGVAFSPSQEGVLVRGVSRDSKLRGYLLEDDVIRGVNQAPIASIREIERALSKARLGEGIVFDILRQGQPMFISVQVQ